MPYPFARRSRSRIGSQVAFTISGMFIALGRPVIQTQFLTEEYVITHLDRGIFIFLASRAKRFLVDESAERLRRLEPHVKRIRVERLRSVIGGIDIQEEEGEFDEEGYTCRRFRFNSTSTRILICGESLVTRVDGIASTAFHQERVYDARTQPFSLPLKPDQIVVRSTLRTLASDFEQNQSYRLSSIDPVIDDRRRLDRIARFPIVTRD